ncbi:hypothetical protein H2203_005041 [Taxawa tesnikishii (nom. ined.)]|nr:hypothetical protein H2203_005041 [Dothideales sp. JES 119]
MKPSLATSFVASCLLLTTSAQLLPFARPKEQSPLHDSIAIPPPDSYNRPIMSGGDNVIISDVLGKSRSINIFAGFTRDVDSVSSRLDTQSQNTTVLAPLNSAVTSLPRKPWEDPKDYAELGANAYDGQAGEDRAHRNLRRFVEAHTVPDSPWEEGRKVQTLAGGTVWWEKKEDGSKVIQPGNVEVESVAEKVANGEVWILKRTLNYA